MMSLIPPLWILIGSILKKTEPLSSKSSKNYFALDRTENLIPCLPNLGLVLTLLLSDLNFGPMSFFITGNLLTRRLSYSV